MLKRMWKSIKIFSLIVSLLAVHLVLIAVQKVYKCEVESETRWEEIQEMNEYIYSKRQLLQLGLTPNSSETYIEDIFIALKSTRSNHYTRVKLLLDTWISMAPDSVYLITDAADNNTSQIFGNGSHYVQANCTPSHLAKDLVCKLQATYNTYMERVERYKWLCIEDDDGYINIPNYVKMLRSYDHREDWYIGKPSLPYKFPKGKKPFWFATGGSSICISRSLALRMKPSCLNQGIVGYSRKAKYPDDVLLGFIISLQMKVLLVKIPLFNTHSEPIFQIDPADLHKQITLSWKKLTMPGDKRVNIWNTVHLGRQIPQYPFSKDPYKIYSLHCHVFPNSTSCEKIKERLGSIPRIT